jgi:hypothetical protein
MSDSDADPQQVERSPLITTDGSGTGTEYVSGRHLAALSEISQVLVTALGFEDAIDHVIATVARALSIESGGILLVDGDELVLQSPAFGRMNELSGPTRISLSSRSNSVSVFKSGRPYLSNDAPKDPAILQGFVEAYNTRNILTVPLQIAGRSIGVFHAVNKLTGDFSNEDADFLSLIAPHLAIIVRSAEMMRALRKQHRELEGVLEIESTLNGAFLSGEGLSGLTETLATLLRAPVVLIDDAGRILTVATAGEIVPDRALAMLCRLLSPAAERNPAVLARTDHLRLSLSQADGATAAVVFSIQVRGDHLGYLAALATKETLDEIQVRALRQAVALFAVEITKDNEVYEIERRLQIDLMDNLFGTTSQPDASRLFRRIAAGLQFPVRVGFLRLFEVESTGTSHGIASYQVRLHRALRHILAECYEFAETVPYREGFVLLIPSPTSPEPDAECERLSASLDALDEAMGTHRAAYQVGFGAPVPTATGIARSFDEALAVIAIEAELDGHNSPLLVEQLDLYRLLLSPTREQDIEEYVQRVLGKLMMYDRERGTDLLPFLRALVEVNFNASRVARSFSVHLNTAKYRRRRIEETLELSLDDSNARFSVQLALKLLAVRNALARRPGASKALP